jgi:hypothetical protein
VKRATAIAGIACSLCVVAPIWVGRILPSVDLPQHIAMASVLLHAGDPRWGFDPFFEAQWGEFTPYWCYYSFVYALSQAFALSVETASRVYLTLYAAALPWAGLYACRAFRRPPVFGLLTAPLALNTYFYQGFLNFIVATVLLLVAVGLLEDQLQEPRRGRDIALGVCSLLLFFAHAQVAAFFLLASVVHVAVHAGPIDAGARVKRLLPVVPGALVLAAWVVRMLVMRAARPFGEVGNVGAWFKTPRENLADLPDALAEVFRDHSDTALLAAWGLVVLAVWISALRHERTGTRLLDLRSASVAFALLATSGLYFLLPLHVRLQWPLLHPRYALVLAMVALSVVIGARAHPFRAEYLVALAMCCYFVAPVQIQGQWSINPRFALLAALLLPTTLRASPALVRVTPFVAVGLSAGIGANAVRQHLRFDAELGHVDEALAAIPSGQRVLPLIYDINGAFFRQPVYLHIGQYYGARRGGIVGGSLAYSDAMPVALRDPQAFPFPMPWAPLDFRFAREGGAYDYYFTKGAPPEIPPANLPPSATEKIYDDGLWRVYRRVTLRVDFAEAPT